MSQQKLSIIELLAPAGSPACLKAACIAGADAVYLAGKRFGARAFAINFDDRSLRWARRVTRSTGKKLYITLNTIVFEHELGMLEETLDFYEALQPDALIIQDLGVASVLCRRKSKIPRHLSTQGAWFGQGGVEQLKKLEFSRIILPRELSIDEISDIRQQMTDIELEVFIHGAMCYSMSGRCFWSSSLGSRSGNRGTCAQPCRKEYKINGDKGKPLFSPKDLRLVSHINQLINAGVSSIKIEGRMKSPEYVYQTVKAYRKVIDTGREPEEEILNEVFSRAASINFFNGPEEEWQTGENVGREGVKVGKTTGKIIDGLVEVELNTEVKPGDGVFWYINKERHGARVTWVKTDRKRPLYALLRGLPLSIKPETDIKRSAQNKEGQWEIKWNRNWERSPVNLFWSGHEGLPLAIETIINEHRLRIETEEPLQFALKQGLEDGPLKEKFSILGEHFKAGKQVFTMLDKGLHISGSALKKIKRQLVENICKLEQLPPPTHQPGLLNKIRAIAERAKHDYSKHFLPEVKPEVRLRVWNNSFPFIRDLAVDCWILPWKGDNYRANQVLYTKIMWWLPPVINKIHFETLIEELTTIPEGEFLCFGWEAFKLAEIFPHLHFTLDWCFNVCNLPAIDFIRSQNVEPVFSKEWKAREIPKNLRGFRASHAWNPLVSFSRFNSKLPIGIIQNSHKDSFFQLPLGNGINGLFLVDKIASVTKYGDVSLQVDVAISPEENPVQTAKDLNRVLEAYRIA